MAKSGTNAMQSGPFYTNSSNRSIQQYTTFDPHTKTHDLSTPGQVALSLVFLLALVLLILSKLGLLKNFVLSVWLTKFINGKDVSEDIEAANGKPSNNSASGNGTKQHAEINVQNENSETKEQPKQFSTLVPPPTFEEFLQYVLAFGVIMYYFYLVDYKKIFNAAPRTYHRDTFLFVVFLLFLVSVGMSLKTTTGQILNRDLTEEWKGWMQVMFVWYHYFGAKEWYNWVRIYIAAYVWMTGFGNFSFFWVKKDYSVWRVLKMLFRLNFLVVVVTVVTSNEYMLYYICPMHTYWFLSVYVFMRCLSSWNEHRLKMAIKFGAYFAFNAVIFEVPVIRHAVFMPFYPLLKYHDNFSDDNVLHEWEFRLTLDHWACMAGMLCAYNYPHFERLIKYIEHESLSNQEHLKKKFLHGLIVFMPVVAAIIWYTSVMGMEKFNYNAVHPYTSSIPILIYVILRNSFPVLRRNYAFVFCWLGKITLETYISQLHIYLQSNAKENIDYLYRFDLPLLNFSLATVIYLIASYILFNLTTEFSAYLLPKDMKKVFKNFVCMALIFVVAYMTAVLRSM